MAKSVTIKDIKAGMPVSGAQREGYILLSGRAFNLVIGVYRGSDGGSHGLELNFTPVGKLTGPGSAIGHFVRIVRALGVPFNFHFEWGMNSFSIIMDKLTDIDILMLQRALNASGDDV